MAEAMKSILERLFLAHWQRKAISVLLALVIWLTVNHTLTATRVIGNVPVRVTNIPAGKTIDGLQGSGFLSKKITLTLAGNKTLLDELASSDLEIIIDASDKPDEWIPTITKKNLVTVNSNLDIAKGITRISHSSFSIHLTKLITEKIPIIITKPLGEPPRNYLFLDVWPYHLYVTITGSEEAVKHLKATGLKVTFNLNEISKRQLDQLASTHEIPNKDVVSFLVPEEWKQLHIPTISDAPIPIDDPQSKALRIDFVRCDLLPIKKTIPIALFFPLDYADQYNPKTCTIENNELISSPYDLPIFKEPLYGKGVSRLFLEMVEDMMEIVIIVSPSTEHSFLPWSIQFINPRTLEDRYVSTLLSDSSDDEISHMHPALREEYLRNRFRSYMSRFQFFKANDAKLDLNISLDKGLISIKEK